MPNWANEGGNGGGGDGLHNESSKQQDTKTKKKPQRVPHAKSEACETMLP